MTSTSSTRKIKKLKIQKQKRILCNKLVLILRAHNTVAWQMYNIKNRAHCICKAQYLLSASTYAQNCQKLQSILTAEHGTD